MVNLPLNSIWPVRVICESFLNCFGNALPLFLLATVLSLDAVCINESFISVTLCIWWFLVPAQNIKSWCERPVSVVCCRSTYADAPSGGVLPRQRPKLSWHNFHHCIGNKVPGLELHVPTQAWKNPRQIPKCVCLSRLFLLCLSRIIADPTMFAHLWFRTLPGNVSVKKKFPRCRIYFC